MLLKSHVSSQVRVAETLDQPKDLGHVPVNAKNGNNKYVCVCVCVQVTDCMDEKGNMKDLGMSVL